VGLQVQIVGLQVQIVGLQVQIVRISLTLIHNMIRQKGEPEMNQLVSTNGILS